MIVFSDLKAYSKIKNSRCVFIGYPIVEDYDESIRNFLFIKNNRIKCIHNYFFFLCVGLISDSIYTHYSINREFVEYCGYDYMDVILWNLSEYRTKEQNLAISFFRACSFFPGFVEFLKLFVTTDGNLDNFYEKANTLLTLCKRYISESEKYLVVKDTLIIAGSLSDVEFFSNEKYPDSIFHDEYTNFLQSIQKIQYFMENSDMNENIMISRKELELLRAIKQQKIVYLNDKGTEFGYQTIIDDKTLISLTFKKSVFVQFENKNRKNYCCYDTDTNKIFGITSSSLEFSFSCSQDVISNDQEFSLNDGKIWFKLFKANYVTFWGTMERNNIEISFTSNDDEVSINKMMFSNINLEDLQGETFSSDYEEECDENFH